MSKRKPTRPVLLVGDLILPSDRALEEAERRIGYALTRRALELTYGWRADEENHWPELCRNAAEKSFKLLAFIASARSVALPVRAG